MWQCEDLRGISMEKRRQGEIKYQHRCLEFTRTLGVFLLVFFTTHGSFLYHPLSLVCLFIHPIIASPGPDFTSEANSGATIS